MRLHRQVRGQSDDRIRHRDAAVAAQLRPILLAAALVPHAHAVGEVIHLPALASPDPAGSARRPGRGAVGTRRRAARFQHWLAARPAHTDRCGPAARAVELDILLLLDDHRRPAAHDALAVLLEAVGVDRRVGDDDEVVVARALLRVVVLAGELERAKDVVLDLAFVVVEVLPTDPGHGNRPLLAEEDAARVELMTAQLRHQPAARSLVEPPAAQLLHALVAQALELPRVLQRFAVLLGDARPPAILDPIRDQVAVLVADFQLLAVLVGLGLGVVAVPQGTDVADIAEHAGGHHLLRVGVEQAVVALVTNRQGDVVLLGGRNHLLARGDVPGHQFLAQDVLAGFHAVDRHRGVQMQRQGDDDHLDLFFLFQHYLVVVGVDLDDLVGTNPVVEVQALAGTVFLARLPPGRLVYFHVTGEDALPVRRADVADGDDLDELRVVLADQHTTLVAGADQGCLDRLAAGAFVGLVAEVDRGRNRDDDAARQGKRLDEVAPGQFVARQLARHAIEVRLAHSFFFGGHVESHRLIPPQRSEVRSQKSEVSDHGLEVLAIGPLLGFGASVELTGFCPLTSDL